MKTIFAVILVIGIVGYFVHAEETHKGKIDSKISASTDSKSDSKKSESDIKMSDLGMCTIRRSTCEVKLQEKEIEIASLRKEIIALRDKSSVNEAFKSANIDPKRFVDVNDNGSIVLRPEDSTKK